MAYCVQCGVELAPSERACPLCSTPVVHPTQPWKEPESYPYAQKVETITRRVNQRYGAYLGTLPLLMIALLSMVSDLLGGGQLTWSAYVLGACACLFTIVLLPFYVEKDKPYFFLTLDVLAAGLYLVLIGWLSGGLDWVWPLGLPLALTAGGGMMLAVYLGRRPGKKILNLLSDIVLIGEGALIATEILVDLYALHHVHMTWSLYALAPAAGLATALRVIERKEKLKESILKRLYL